MVPAFLAAVFVGVVAAAALADASKIDAASMRTPTDGMFMGATRERKVVMSKSLAV